jgi:hypothetical protein
MFITVHWEDMYRAADQTDRCHLRLGTDAVALFAVVVEEFFCCIPVWRFHINSPGVEYKCTIRAK